MIPEVAVEGDPQLPQSWAEWHKARLAPSKPLTYEQAQAGLAIWKSGALFKRV